jgi:hypothetical protein
VYKVEKRAREQTITFSEEYYEGVKRPHDDALVLDLKIGDHRVGTAPSKKGTGRHG